MRSFMRCGVALCALGLFGCNSGSDSGSSPDSGIQPSGPTITIQSSSFSPVSLTVDAGAVIGIVNRDTVAHTVTSEAADDTFTAGGVNGVSFDTGQVQPTTTGTPPPPYGGGGYLQAATAAVTITIPANAPSGTVIPYFCANHTSMMTTPNGHITVR